MTGPATTPPLSPLLSTTGNVYVTHAAAATYARAAADIYEEGEEIESLEEARRELTDLLLDARRVTGDTETPERWRYRSSARGVDISARVVREGRLAVVVSISARPRR